MLPNKFYHYRGSEFVLEKRNYRLTVGLCKPDGLWISVEDYSDDQTWKTWCETEDFGSLDYKYQITLKSSANVLHLDSAESIIEFTKKHILINSSVNTKKFIHEIDWFTVKQLYDGIIIAPYQWDCRHDGLTSWYYGWDCASGCIWNIDCIESCELINSPQLEVK